MRWEKHVRLGLLMFAFILHPPLGVTNFRIVEEFGGSFKISNIS